MRAIYTADVHGDMGAWERFAELLSTTAYDFGLIGGDLTDDSLELTAIKELANADDDELLEELYDPEDTIEDLDARVIAYMKDPTTPLARATKTLEERIKSLFHRAAKPVFLIPGNHDRSEWTDTELISNVHGRRLDIGEFNVVGYRWTSLDRDPAEHADDVEQLAPMVDRKTILITHSPRLGVLDKNHRGISIGSRELRHLVRRRRPYFHLCGHVHHSFGIRRHSANGSYVAARAFIDVDVDHRQLAVIGNN